jgi:sulfur-oxidizing protein SoxY
MLRREFLKYTAIAGATALLSGNTLIAAVEEGKKTTVDEIIATVTNKKGAKSGNITLVAPQIAENGLVVPLKVDVNSPMTNENYVKAIHLFAVDNPVPKISSITLSPANGKAYFSTRTKLAKSTDILAIAELSDGTFVKDVKSVKVTIGGCG